MFNIENIIYTHNDLGGIIMNLDTYNETNTHGNSYLLNIANRS